MTAIRIGVRPNGTVMLPFMPWPSYYNWDEDNLLAVWLYLRSLESIAHEIPVSTLTGAAVTEAGIDWGEGLYEVYCVICHGEQGSGGSFTDVALKDVSKSLDDARLSGFISKGLPGSAMPGFSETLTEEQIADLVVFIRSWQ